MNDKFEELTKGMAQSVTRRGALIQCRIKRLSMTHVSPVRPV